MNTLKYKADLLYFQNKFETALVKYKLCIQLIGRTNHVFHRDIGESIARCYVALGHYEDAESSVKALVCIFYDTVSDYTGCPKKGVDKKL